MHSPDLLFSYMRHVLGAYIDSLEHRSGAQIKHAFVADYLCHEVISFLRQRHIEVYFYTLDSTLSPDVASVARMLQKSSPGDLFILSHFFGKTPSCGQELVQLISQRRLIFIEDLAQSSFLKNRSFKHSIAQFYTFRKTFCVPYGASLEGTDRPHFDRYIEKYLTTFRGPAWTDQFFWLMRSLLKAFILKAGLNLQRKYRDLSDDDLVPFELAGGLTSWILERSDFVKPVQLRRNIYKRYLLNWNPAIGEILSMDLDQDVPYQLALILPERRDAKEWVNDCLQAGIPAQLGSAFCDEIRQTLPKNHLYNRIVTLPVHQDISFASVDQILHLLEKVQRDPRKEDQRENVKL